MPRTSSFVFPGVVLAISLAVPNEQNAQITVVLPTRTRGMMKERHVEVAILGAGTAGSQLITRFGKLPIISYLSTAAQGVQLALALAVCPPKC